MSCDDHRRRLTAYLDGDLDADHGSAMRGHLRECAACRQVASDEAALRDGLRALPPVDPPPSLWAGVQAQLAAAEVADARRPAWKRLLVRWAPAVPRVATGGLFVAAAIAVLWWRAHREPEAGAPSPGKVALAPVAVEPPPRPTPSVMPAGDVTADLAAEAAQVTATYGNVAEELLALATEARGEWSRAYTGRFDARLAELRAAIDLAAEGRARQRAWRAMISFLQGAVVRDEIALAGGGR